MKIQKTIEQKINERFNPEHLEVINESHMHNVPPGSESHFKLIIVSNDFDGKNLVGRHKEVNKTLAEELKGEVHALALHTYSPEEWQSKNPPDSPQCLGGSNNFT